MADKAHKFYCVRCDIYLFGENLTSLAAEVNRHTTIKHPTDFASWTAEGIPHSANYSGSGPLPQYLAAYNSSRKSLTLTDEDRAMLAAGHVKWD